MQRIRILYRWIFEPIVMPLWASLLLWISGIIGMTLWVEQLTPITEASFCFMDAVLWVDGLINYWHGGIVSGQMEGDRPPLSLWMGAWLLLFWVYGSSGFTAGCPCRIINGCGYCVGWVAEEDICCIDRLSVLVGSQCAVFFKTDALAQC